MANFLNLYDKEPTDAVELAHYQQLCERKKALLQQIHEAIPVPQRVKGLQAKLERLDGAVGKQAEAAEESEKALADLLTTLEAQRAKLPMGADCSCRQKNRKNDQPILFIFRKIFVHFWLGISFGFRQIKLDFNHI